MSRLTPYSTVLHIRTLLERDADYLTVDGGHRAIKYSRLGGVKKEIYAEGMKAPQLTTQLSNDLPN